MANSNVITEIHLYGLLTVISVLIALFIVSLILIKAIKTEELKLYIFTVAAFFMVSSWFPTSIGYIYWVLTRETFSIITQLFLGLFFVPIAIICWLEIYRRVENNKLGLFLIIIYGVLSIVAEGYLIYYLYLVPNAPVESMVAETHIINNYLIHINYIGYLVLFALISIVIAWVTGNHFALISIRKGFSKETHIKGRFIFIGFNLFLVVVILETFYYILGIMILVRVLLVLTMLFLYWGFLLPQWLKNLFIK